MFKIIPTELIREIMYNLSISEILRISTTSREIHAITEDVLFWQHLSVLHGETATINEKITCQLKILQLNLGTNNDWGELPEILRDLSDENAEDELMLEYIKRLNGVCVDDTPENVEDFLQWSSETLSNKYQKSKLWNRIFIMLGWAAIGSLLASIWLWKFDVGTIIDCIQHSHANDTARYSLPCSSVALLTIASTFGVCSLPCIVMLCCALFYYVNAAIKKDRHSPERRSEDLLELSRHNFVRFFPDVPDVTTPLLDDKERNHSDEAEPLNPQV
jgi:hypothetical protein